MIARAMGDQNALFAQYEAEYCTSSTNVARKIQGLSIIAGGALLTPSPPGPLHPLGEVPEHSELTLPRLGASRAATSQRTGGRERLEGGGPNSALSALDALRLRHCFVRGGEH